jgi:hypothetical protein
MVTLLEIKTALESIRREDGDDAAKYIEEAIRCLKTAGEAMNTVSVRGRHDVDTMLGCMIGIDLIIGEDKDGR